MNKIISDAISNLRLPLMVGVVAIHCAISGCDELSFVSRLFSVILPISCVPCFFLISGFLFFHNIDRLTPDIYLKKMKSRFWSLVVPYLIWNTFMILCYGAAHKLAPDIMNPENENVWLYSFTDWFHAYWDKSGGQPVAFQLWFLKTLIVITIATPIFYIGIKYNKIVSCLVLVALAVFSRFNGLIWASFYFYLGAVMSKIDFDNQVMKKISKSKALIFSVTLFVLYLFCVCYNFMYDSHYLIVIQCFVGVIVLLCIGLLTARKYGKIGSLLAETSFFIYGFHAFPVFVIKELERMFILDKSPVIQVFSYFLSIAFIVAISICLYFILKKLFPKALNIAVGNRTIVK